MALEAGHHHGGAGANYLDMHAAPELDSTGMFVSGAPSDEYDESAQLIQEVLQSEAEDYHWSAEKIAAWSQQFEDRGYKTLACMGRDNPDANWPIELAFVRQFLRKRYSRLGSSASHHGEGRRRNSRVVSVSGGGSGSDTHSTPRSGSPSDLAPHHHTSATLHHSVVSSTTTSPGGGGMYSVSVASPAQMNSSDSLVGGGTGMGGGGGGGTTTANTERTQTPPSPGVSATTAHDGVVTGVGSSSVVEGESATAAALAAHHHHYHDVAQEPHAAPFDALSPGQYMTAEPVYATYATSHTAALFGHHHTPASASAAAAAASVIRASSPLPPLSSAGDATVSTGGIPLSGTTTLHSDGVHATTMHHLHPANAPQSLAPLYSGGYVAPFLSSTPSPTGVGVGGVTHGAHHTQPLHFVTAGASSTGTEDVVVVSGGHSGAHSHTPTPPPAHSVASSLVDDIGSYDDDVGDEAGHLMIPPLPLSDDIGGATLQHAHHHHHHHHLHHHHHTTQPYAVHTGLGVGVGVAHTVVGDTGEPSHDDYFSPEEISGALSVPATAGTDTTGIAQAGSATDILGLGSLGANPTTTTTQHSAALARSTVNASTVVGLAGGHSRSASLLGAYALSSGALSARGHGLHRHTLGPSMVTDADHDSLQDDMASLQDEDLDSHHAAVACMLPDSR